MSGLRLRDGAIFVADAHYPRCDGSLISILRHIQKSPNRYQQLFLAGDIFDLLFGYSPYCYEKNREAVDLLHAVSTETETIYIEGNHDFALENLFDNILTVPRQKQPLLLDSEYGTVAVSHGDRFETGLLYDIYSAAIRSKLLIRGLAFLHRQAIDTIVGNLKKKDICRRFDGFEEKIQRILSHYPEDIPMVIEGHFHRAEIIGRYVSLPSLACQKQLALFENGKMRFVNIDEFIS